MIQQEKQRHEMQTTVIRSKAARIADVKETVLQIIPAILLGTVAFFLGGILYLLIERSNWV